jgi:hypothetical protein
VSHPNADGDVEAVLAGMAAHLDPAEPRLAVAVATFDDVTSLEVHAGDGSAEHRHITSPVSAEPGRMA